MNRLEPVTSSTEAYTKAVLHCLKYPTRPVMGLLLGKHADPNPDAGAIQKGPAAAAAEDTKKSDSTEAKDAAANEASEAKQPTVMVLDAVPLFHSAVIAAPHPLVDVAVQLARSSAEKDACHIVGLYVANERLDDRKLSPLVTPLLQKLQQEATAGSSMVVWMIDNASLTTPPKVPCITTLLMQKGVSSPYLNGQADVPSAVLGGNFLMLVSPAKVVKVTGTGSSEGPTGGSSSAAAASEKNNHNHNSNTNSNRKLSDLTEMDQIQDLMSAKKAKVLNTVTLLTLADWLTAAVSSSAHHHLIDFEDHLEEPELNFVDQPLHQLIVQQSAGQRLKSG